MRLFTQGKHRVGFLVDDDVSAYSWHLLNTRGKQYVYRRENKKTIYLHREIMDPGKGMVVDHINGDSLDNRRSNLRVCLHKENVRNTSKSKGYYIDKRNKYRPYIATIMIDGKNKHLGNYATAKEATKTYLKATVQYFGDYAPKQVSS